MHTQAKCELVSVILGRDNKRGITIESLVILHNTRMMHDVIKWCCSKYLLGEYT